LKTDRPFFFIRSINVRISLRSTGGKFEGSRDSHDAWGGSRDSTGRPFTNPMR
jgi:hypothetical protein